MESFSKELVSKATAQLILDITFGAFTKFLQEQLNLEDQWEVTISEMSYPSMYHNVT